jgi:hypothetical protein
MRAFSISIATLLGGVVVSVALLGGPLGGLRPAAAAEHDGAVAVDLELVLAVDVSISMDADEQGVQRQGYAAAFRHEELIGAIGAGPLGRIAVTYVEWAGDGVAQVVVPWTLIDTAEASYRFADLLDAAPMRRAQRTSISHALIYSAAMFPRSGFAGTRKVIDVSGDGANNQGLPVTAARDTVIAEGITINGLPLMIKPPAPTTFFDIADLDVYYRDCVIGGFAAFLIPVKSLDELAGSVRRKLVLEVAGRMPEAALVPAQFYAGPSPADCLIGERLWRDWMDRDLQ